MSTNSSLIKLMEFDKYDILIPFVCRQCGSCCQNFVPLIYLEDMSLIAKHLNQPQKEIERKYKYCYSKKFTTNQTNCIFLSKNNQCSIYPLRPEGCQLYPFTDFGAANVDCPGEKEFFKITMSFDYYTLDFKKNDQMVRTVPIKRWSKLYKKFMNAKPSKNMIKKFIELNEIPEEIFKI